jgi:hypothetical protein
MTVFLSCLNLETIHIKVHPPYEPGYVIPCAANLAEENLSLNISEIPIDVCIPKVR